MSFKMSLNKTSEKLLVHLRLPRVYIYVTETKVHSLNRGYLGVKLRWSGESAKITVNMLSVTQFCTKSRDTSWIRNSIVQYCTKKCKEYRYW